MRALVTIEGVPARLGAIALAETVTPGLVDLVAAASGVDAPAHVASFLAHLVTNGVLHPDARDPRGATYRVDADHQASMMAALRLQPGGLRQVRADLIRCGLAAAPRALGGQLAIWAHQNADWASLSALWLTYPPAAWGRMTETAVQVFARVPDAARKEFPALTQAAAMTAALDPSKAGTSSDQAVRQLRRDGRLLHSGWAGQRSLDACVRAGSIWMMAQRTMAGHADPLDAAWATRQAIASVISRQTLDGHSPLATAQTLFHATSAATALLRGDVYQASADGEQAMMLGHPGDTWALIGAGLEALALGIVGNPRGCQRAADWFDAHTAACGVFAKLATPYLQLALALAAIRLLDRDRAVECLREASALEEESEFWSAYAWIRSMYDLTWFEPGYGMARLDAIVSRNPSAAEFETLSDTLAVRARADLLCSAGRIHEAKALLTAGSHSKLNRFHLVSEARMHLCSQDGAEAIRVAEQGLHDVEIHGPARAHLQTIRSAGLLLTGANPGVVGKALRAACTLCTELANVLPLVLIPADLRLELLVRHDRLSHETPCIFGDAVIRERLTRVWANLGSAPGLIHLTPREELLLPRLASSETVETIAENFGVSVNTVRKQVVTLRRKFDAPTRGAMIAAAYELGLLAGRD